MKSFGIYLKDGQSLKQASAAEFNIFFPILSLWVGGMGILFLLMVSLTLEVL